MELKAPDTYTWTPLPDSRHSRLLQLFPSDSFEQPIECSIITTSTDDPCKYRALSYAWGEIQQDGSHFNTVIYCDGMSMRVTQHLDMALKRIRASTTTWYRKLPIWVDTISIAQDSSEEKAQQVLMISEIFGKCRHLTIWLGELSNQQDDDLCRAVAAKFQQWEDEGMEIELSLPEQNLLTTVLERSWFQRRWIIQEVLVANTSGLTPYFRIGEHGWNWPFMVYITGKAGASEARDKFLLLVRRMVADNLIPGPFAVSRPSARDLLDASRRPLYNSIIETLHVFDAAKCYDPRDRLYALLSMGWGPGKFSVDYTASVEDIYIRFAATLVRATSDDFLPAVLASASCRKGKAQVGLPSWVPDWRKTVDYSSKTNRATVERSTAQDAGFAINEYHGDTRSIFETNALLLHHVSLISVCNHMPTYSATKCAFCGLRQSSEALISRDDEPCSHDSLPKTSDCEDCRLANPLAAHALRELSLLRVGQVICLLPKSHMALVLRPTQAQKPCDMQGYVIEHCLSIPPHHSGTNVLNFWQTRRELPRCEVTIV